MEWFVSEINQFQKRLFWFLNFLGAAILNICDVLWLLICICTKSFCFKAIGQP